MPPRRIQKKQDIPAAPTAPRVLIVEDDAPMLDALVFKLGQMDITAATAQDGEEAIAEIRAREWPVIIVDILLSKKDGFAVLEAIRREPWAARAAVFVFSNLGKAEYMQRALNLGARAFIEKTKVSLTDIAQTIADALDKTPS